MVAPYAPRAELATHVIAEPMLMIIPFRSISEGRQCRVSIRGAWKLTVELAGDELGFGVGELRRQAQSGVVDQHVEAAESGEDVLGTRRPGAVGSARSAAIVTTSQIGARRPQLVGQPVEPVEPAGGQDQRRGWPTAGEFPRQACPMPAEAPVIRMTGRGASSRGSPAIRSRLLEDIELRLVRVLVRVPTGVVLRVVLCVFAPARGEGVDDPELVADPGDDEIDEVLEASRAVIPAGHRREHDGPGLRDPHHVLQMDQAQRRLARDQDQLATLLQMDVGRARDQVRA